MRFWLILLSLSYYYLIMAYILKTVQPNVIKISSISNEPFHEVKLPRVLELGTLKVRGPARLTTNVFRQGP